uniref:Small ribosomal subunit protein bS16c n=1 Tax=Gracilaria tenuistipitata var. liui TaxID=285951 RepID=RR16_GRATL|nr:30S ribosomal protein S16 [Gracilaria tenuistipitata var. liui]Q6B914.1 RecName: Full=Small ribosomal subunit protein bS16c; AltName: Full=30S ribosomal protein S16, chloroplastic [Gracilaria tenuistipitata var. liui]AAT79621.1 30S ribosomal protein S16 [Gracilaria tenuistipitata var. liui]
MLKIRLKRFGRKRQPSYRIIVIDSRKPRDGRPIEEIGFYSPLNNKSKINLIQVKKRIYQGAQPTKKVQQIISQFEKQN